MHKPSRLLLTFDDLPLQLAIRMLFQDADFVRSEVPLITDSGREWTLQKIIVNLPAELLGHYRFEHILLSVNQYRKLSKESRHKREIILQHAAKQKHHSCFYEGKLETDCSVEVDLDRIRPGKRGGEYTVDNTVLSCSRHNRARGCKQVELYWSQ